MFETKFIIKDFPTDVYKYVGEIIEKAQNFEKSYKELANLLKVKVKKVENSSLNKLNEALKKENLISQKEFENLQAVINIRNYINHTFYLEHFQKQYESISYDDHIKYLEKYLNSAIYLIFEATDVIDNKIDYIKGKNIKRPTIFDYM